MEKWFIKIVLRFIVYTIMKDNGVKQFHRTSKFDSYNIEEDAKELLEDIDSE